MLARAAARARPNSARAEFELPSSSPGVIHLRRTLDSDLDFVLALEYRPGQSEYIGQWTREEHLATKARADREHWIIERDQAPVGYLIAYDVRSDGWGAYIKRIAVSEPGQGVGRLALGAYLARDVRSPA
jgi:diamine N-acetyltransferase